MPTDVQLMERVRSDATGDALRSLYRAYAGELLGFALGALDDRQAAEEIVQETFTRAWRHADRYDAKRGSVRTWLYQIARNAIIDARRRASVRPGLASREADPDREAGGLSIERAMLGWQVAAALERLSVDAAQILAPAGIAVNCLRIDVPVASEGFVANMPGTDTTGWESTAGAAEAVLWMLTRPESYTAQIESLHGLRDRGVLPSAVGTPSDPRPPLALVTGIVGPAQSGAPMANPA